MRANGEARFQHSASGPLHIFRGVYSPNIYQETFMKSIAKAILVGGFMVAAQAAVAGGVSGDFPLGAEQISANAEPPVRSTYQSQHAGDQMNSAD